ncbi:hypothetical protein AK812_SmicGene43797 [Symbiodinium microadriaticum]|uniref:EF-hand domain-containing protein n=2 Tax=Symbiodinium TaxID=2949 RepID=A0A1Q9C035_SYMMI|nr:hypothetical protein AK812_SmicGene43797 [Symbiodinium microadriaticum]
MGGQQSYGWGFFLEWMGAEDEELQVPGAEPFCRLTMAGAAVSGRVETIQKALAPQAARLVTTSMSAHPAQPTHPAHAAHAAHSQLRAEKELLTEEASEAKAESTALRGQLKTLEARCEKQALQVAELSLEPAQIVRRLQGEVAFLENRVLEQQAALEVGAKKAELTLRAELDVKSHEVLTLRRTMEARENEVRRYQQELEAIIAELSVLRDTGDDVYVRRGLAELCRELLCPYLYSGTEVRSHDMAVTTRRIDPRMVPAVAEPLCRICGAPSGRPPRLEKARLVTLQVGTSCKQPSAFGIAPVWRRRSPCFLVSTTPSSTVSGENRQRRSAHANHCPPGLTSKLWVFAHFPRRRPPAGEYTAVMDTPFGGRHCWVAESAITFVSCTLGSSAAGDAESTGDAAYKQRKDFAARRMVSAPVACNKLYTRVASKRSHRAEMCPQHQHLDGSSVSQPIMTKLSSEFEEYRASKFEFEASTLQPLVEAIRLESSGADPPHWPIPQSRPKSGLQSAVVRKTPAKFVMVASPFRDRGPEAVQGLQEQVQGRSFQRRIRRLISQLVSLKQVVASGPAPCADFCLFGPYGLLLLGKQTFTSSRPQNNGPNGSSRSEHHTTAGWRLGKSCRLSDAERLEAYAKHVQGYVTPFGDDWWLVYRAENRLRCEHMELLRRIHHEKHDYGYTQARSWNAVFAAAIRDSEFWTCELVTPAPLWLSQQRAPASSSQGKGGSSANTGGSPIKTGHEDQQPQGPVSEERAGAGSEATRVVEVSNDEALGTSAPGQRAPSTGQSSWRHPPAMQVYPTIRIELSDQDTGVAKQRAEEHCAGVSRYANISSVKPLAEIPDGRTGSRPKEGPSAVLLSEFGKTLEQDDACTILQLTSLMDPCNVDGCSSAACTPQNFPAVAAQGFRAETRSRTVPDLPDPDLAAATEGKMTNLPSCRSPSRPRSPKHDELYEDAAARRERHQDRLGEQMRRQQRNEAEEQMGWEGGEKRGRERLEKERWQDHDQNAFPQARPEFFPPSAGPLQEDLRSHLERELELLQKRQLAREKEEMQECTFWPNTSRKAPLLVTEGTITSKLSYEAIRSGSRSRNSINGINALGPECEQQLRFDEVAVGVGAAAAALRTSVSRFGSYTRHTPSRAKSAVKKTRAGLQQHRSKASSLSRRSVILVLNMRAAVRGLSALAWLQAVLAAPKTGKGSGGSLDDLQAFADKFKGTENNPEAAASALNSLDPTTLGNSMADLMVNAMDKDGDGILTETEIASVSAPPGADGDTLQKAKDMFKQMDKNGDEQVTRKEAQAYFQQLGNTLKGMTGMMGGEAPSSEL